MAGMVAALAGVAGPVAGALTDWVPDPAIERIVSSWPALVRADPGAWAWAGPDPDFESIDRMHIAEPRG